MENQKAPQSRNNNFTVLRLCAALMVLSGHMGYIVQGSVPTLFGRQIQTLGVYIFFLIGGYLITHSWLSDPHPVRYAIRRFMRIWPPLAVFVLFASFVAGPLLSTLPPLEYFRSYSLRAYLRNLVLYVMYALPGVFTDLPYPHAVNGSLWTLPIEVLMYIAVPLLLTVLRMQSQSKASRIFLIVICALVCGLDLYVYTCYPSLRVVIYGTDWVSALHIIPFYLIGVVCTLPEFRKILNLQVACALLLVCSCLNMNYVCTQIMLFCVLPYIVFSLAFAPMPVFSFLQCKAEISYGLYLYGFFVQQLVVDITRRCGLQITFMPALILSCLGTIAMAYGSYYLVERPAHAFSKKILKRLR